MSVDPQKVAKTMALLEKALGLTPKPKPKTKAVVNDGEVVRDADVRVSRADPNYYRSEDGVVRVRRKDFVTVRMDLYEEQMREKAEARRARRALDPYRLGHWGEEGEDD